MARAILVSFFRSSVFKIRNSCTLDPHNTSLLSFTVERANSQRSLWRPLICPIMT